MNDRFEPSPDFVARVMLRIEAYEDTRLRRLVRLFRLLAAGGALVGILRAAPVF